LKIKFIIAIIVIATSIGMMATTNSVLESVFANKGVDPNPNSQKVCEKNSNPKK
jgi:hypothetical protein